MQVKVNELAEAIANLGARLETIEQYLGIAPPGDPVYILSEGTESPPKTNSAPT